MPEQEVCIEARDVIKTYKGGQQRALDGVNLSIFEGEIFGLIGPNGAGKSTLLGCLLGLLRPDSGSVSVAGKPADFLSVKRLTGYMPERPDFEHWMTGRQFLAYHHMLAGSDSSDVAAQIESELSTVELDKAAWDRKLGTYSRGMLQRLNLAQVLVGAPTILMLDEPTLGLDPTGVAVVRRLVSQFRKSGVTAIINSHQLDEVERECDRVAFLRNGKIEQVENLRSGPSGPYLLFVRWSATDGRSAKDGLESLSARVGVTIQDSGECWARFAVADGHQAASIIKQLVTGGFPVEEAVTEVARLERLFTKNAEECGE